MGQPTHVLVDTLQHPAVELTQAEGAAVDSSDVSDTSSASSSSSNSLDLVNDYLTDDWMVIITGIIGGCIGCVLLLAIVSLSMRRCYRGRNTNRNHKHNRNRDSNGLSNSDSSSDKGCYNDILEHVSCIKSLPKIERVQVIRKKVIYSFNNME